MAGVLRGKVSGVSPKLLPGYVFHDLIAVLALWLAIQGLMP